MKFLQGNKSICMNWAKNLATPAEWLVLCSSFQLARCHSCTGVSNNGLLCWLFSAWGACKLLLLENVPCSGVSGPMGCNDKKNNEKQYIRVFFKIEGHKIISLFYHILDYWISHGTFIEVIKDKVSIPSLLCEDFCVLDISA